MMVRHLNMSGHLNISVHVANTSHSIGKGIILIIVLSRSLVFFKFFQSPEVHGSVNSGRKKWGKMGKTVFLAHICFFKKNL